MRTFRNGSVHLLAALVAIGSCSASPAEAQEGAPTAEEIERARGLFQSGRALLEAEEWEAGLDVLRRSFAIVERPSVAFSMAFALVRLERAREALEVLAVFEAIADPEQDASLVEGAARLRAEAEAMRSSPPTVSSRIEPAPASPPPVDPPVPSGSEELGGWMVAGVSSSVLAGLALVLSITFTALAASEQAAFDEMPTHEIADRGEAFAATAYVSYAMLGVGGVVAGVSFVFAAEP